MKKKLLFMVVLMVGGLLTACGQANIQGVDMVPGTIGSDHQSSVVPGTVGSGDQSDGVPGITGGGNQSLAVSGGGVPEEREQYREDPKAANMGEDVEESVEEEAFLSDQILKVGDTMQIMYPVDENTLYPGLEITLQRVQLSDSPETAGLNRAQMVEKTENYDVSGEPEWCSIDEGKVLVCDLTIKNMDEDSDGELHMSEIMVAYADPNTRKVTIITCSPAYFSASSSHAGASDYYHYQVPKGESRDMTVAWMIQKEYEAENLYLCITYDVREPQERQYFRMVQ